MLALCNARVLIGDAFISGSVVLIDGPRIVAVGRDDEVAATAERIDLDGAMLIPGFIDIQVNGGGDALFNDDPSVETIRRIGAAHARFGTTGFLPTLISDDLSVIRAGIAAVDAAIGEGVPGVLGIHVEGPFINVERKGIHSADKIRAIDGEDVAVLTSLRRGRMLVTLAPELAGAEVIQTLVAAGVIVSAGHTAGTAKQIAQGFEAGVTGVTHLFNAMPPLENREPGPVGAALIDDRIWCSLIVDGLHVDPVTLSLAMRCKPIDRWMLVTDAMPPTGGSSATFRLNGRRIMSDGGRLIDEDGVLAGADLTMIDAVRNAQRLMALSPEAAIGMATVNPAAFLSLTAETGLIAPQRRASLLAIDDEWRIRRCWIDGIEQPLS